VIAQAAAEPTLVLTWAVCATGLPALAYLVWRHRTGRPVLKTSPAAFARVNPVALGLTALAYFLFYALVGTVVLTEDLSPAAALSGALAILAGGLGVYVVVLRRVFRPRGRQAERIGRGFLVLWAAMPVVFGAFLLLQAFGLEGSQESITWMAERRPGWRIVALHAVLVAPVAAHGGGLRRDPRPPRGRASDGPLRRGHGVDVRDQRVLFPLPPGAYRLQRADRPSTARLN